jgi:hypothetical protein
VEWAFSLGGTAALAYPDVPQGKKKQFNEAGRVSLI